MKTPATPLSRVCLHLRCIITRPRNWRFYLAGIMREIHPVSH